MDTQRDRKSSNSIAVEERAPHKDTLNPLSMAVVEYILSKRTG